MVSHDEEISGCLKALADPTRLAIVTRLRRGELSVHEVADEFPMSRPAISKHLRILREAGLVAERAAGRERIYAMAAEPLYSIRSWLAQLGIEEHGAGSSYSSFGSGSSSRSRVKARSSSAVEWRVW
jgi:DNA-binding transcriptional ArsR family regulator